MDDPGGIILKLILLLLLILVNAFFAMSEIAVISPSKRCRHSGGTSTTPVSLDNSDRSHSRRISYLGKCFADLCRYDSQSS